MSQYHTSYGYTTHRVSEAEQREFDNEYKGKMDATAKRFLGRADFVEFTDNDEILIKDDFGIHIMYDCVETDMDLLKEEILLAGSFFIKNQEPLMDAENPETLTPIIDRISTLEKLMQFESQFHFKKAKLVKLYMEAYEHITDPVEQQRFIQMVTDLMAERPRLNLDSCSFEDSYKLELHVLDKRTELILNIIRFQICHEKKINEDICDYLEKAHKMVNDHIDGKWKYFRAQDVNAEFSHRNLEREAMPNTGLSVNTENIKEETKDNKNKGNPSREKSPTKKDHQDLYK